MPSTSLLFRTKSFLTLFLVSLLLITTIAAYSQSDPLEKRTTLQVQSAPLEQVLSEITKQTGVRFSYNSQLINPKTKISVNAQNKTIKEVLPMLLPTEVSYKKVGEHIVFYATPFPEKNIAKTEMHVNNSFAGLLEDKPESLVENDITSVEKNDASDNGKPDDNCLYVVSVAEDTVNLQKDTLSLTQEEDMKSQIAGLMLAVATASAPVVAQDNSTHNNNIQQQESEFKDLRFKDLSEENIISEEKVVLDEEPAPLVCRPAQLTFIYPLGTGFTKSAEKCYHFSVNILGGVTGQLKGFEIGSLYNINKYGAHGAQFAGIFNFTHAGNPEINSRNAQFAGIFNHTQKGNSAQFAGIFNNGDMAYLQAGGIFNIANKSYAQFAGVFNIAKKTGTQFGGIFNISHKTIAQFAGVFNVGDTAHFQAAGIWNSAKKTKCQLAGIANVAQESVCQIAGVVNVTKKGRFQLGVINVRDTADGISLGVINIVKKGGVLEAGIEASEFVHTALTFRSGVPRLYSIISVGYNYTENFWTVGSGLGTRFKLVGNLGFNLELTYKTLYYRDNFFKTNYRWASLIQFSPQLNYRFAKHFKIYAGPSFNLFYEYSDNIFGNYHITKVPYSLYHKKLPSVALSSRTLDLWIGVVGGIKF